MSRSSCSLVLAGLLAGCVAAPGTRTDAGPADAGGMTAAWREAYNTRDPARIVALYDGEAVLWGTTARKVANTPEGVAAYFAGARSRPNARVSFGEENLRVYGDVAFNSGYYTFSDVRDGVETARPARYTFVYRLRDGQWRIVAHHSSELPKN